MKAGGKNAIIQRGGQTFSFNSAEMPRACGWYNSPDFTRTAHAVQHPALTTAHAKLQPATICGYNIELDSYDRTCPDYILYHDYKI